MRVRAIEHNGLEQYLILRRLYLPQGRDTVDDIAAAIWLDNRYWENMHIAVANGISTAFKGSE
ncbi:hypothetical protein Sant_2534 [Sodalis praecaptivus]|uniref:Uncharacterized protein n=1 Tax=Sodalis praecaptivus TaxID=1239307 RepID=W0HUX9_9GAMM|nr:hypothetical protein [Sodalis praecaptivus]AHF77569.1 hypothetical protein Sant_2534 [Sodalis praecaptivus]